MDYTNFPIPKVTYREKRPNRKKKKLETYKGIKIPPKKVRGNISKKEYEKALDYYGGGCAVTGNTNIEMHHIVFRSQSGRGTWRNLVPLCKELHDKCHREREYAEYWRERAEQQFGKYFMCDKWDLYKKGLIVNCTDEAFEKFMKERGNNGKQN